MEMTTTNGVDLYTYTIPEIEVEITIKLKSGRKIKLTRDELDEMIDALGTFSKQPMRVYPSFPEDLWPIIPEITC